MGRWNR